MPPLLLPTLSKAIAENTDAELIFVENLSPEFGPAGAMPFKEKLEWCERACRGRKIDTVIGPGADESILTRWNYIKTDLASSNRDWRHDREKLQQAIEARVFRR
jgi:2-phospho-L-lactate transferase/gluconeogenesis factor (CofD/UPF0052 family)